MPLHQRIPYTIPAGGLLANLLTGVGIEYLGRASVVDLWITADAAGDTFGLTRTLGGDQVTLIPVGTSINVASAAGAGPKTDEDIYLTGAAIPMGAHLIMPISGTAAHTGRSAFNVVP